MYVFLFSHWVIQCKLLTYHYPIFLIWFDLMCLVFWVWLAIEGYIIIVTNLHEESTEDDILDIFEEFGSISNIHLNLDRQSGYVKGYALLEFNNFENSINAIKNLNNTELLGQTIFVDFAFTENKKINNNSDNNDNDYRNYKIRDKSPIRWKLT